jgi:hypothetical protein
MAVPIPPPPAIDDHDADLERALALSLMDVTNGLSNPKEPPPEMKDHEMKDTEVKGIVTGGGLIPEGTEEREEGA